MDRGHFIERRRFMDQGHFACRFETGAGSLRPAPPEFWFTGR